VDTLGREGPFTPPPTLLPERIGRYRVLRKLGQGGMGVVYLARDDRLDRDIALKTLSGAGDDSARRRLAREAKTAATVNHPNVCQLYEIGEDGDSIFLAMELLEGEALSDRLRRGPMVVKDAVPVALGILSALEALHARGVIHRDLKPSNVFLTPHGVKLLDFGLARSVANDAPIADVSVTQPGMLMGTPRYMAPEQARGDEADTRSDLFSVGAMLFEMLAGRPAFPGSTVIEVLHATLHEEPPALAGSHAIVAADRVIRHALAKDRDARYPNAAAMARELDAVTAGDVTGAVVQARAMTRLIVVPFRILRPDAETDFLAHSVAEAVATSLAESETILVRSPLMATRFAGQSDVRTIALEADVDMVLTGTLMRAGGVVRVTAQLVEAPSGTLVWSGKRDEPLGDNGDLFQVQDDLARHLVESLPVASHAEPPSPDVPRSARAYEFYLRANELNSGPYDQLKLARDLYEQCLREDAGFAPAWARLGRCHRVIGKYIEDRAGNLKRAEDAFERALFLSPNLAIAHKFYAALECEANRAPQAMQRLIGLATRDRNDPELFAGLTQACRYCGLIEASLAAHEEAKRLDAHARTSHAFTLWAADDLEAVVRLRDPQDPELTIFGLYTLGRTDEARSLLATVRPHEQVPVIAAILETTGHLLEGQAESAVAALLHLRDIHFDPEAIFFYAQMLAPLGRPEQVLGGMRAALDAGYNGWAILRRSRLLDPLRSAPEFATLLERSEERRQANLAAFRDAGGEALLGAR
jgi:TolB-like protein/predicted Ser/Thr protein kinase